ESNVGLAREMDRISRTAGVGTSVEDKVKMSGQARIAEAELASARAARVLAEHNLFRSQVRAPYPGQMNQRRVTAGTFIEDKSVIGTMADLSRLRLVGWIPEKAAPLVRQMLAEEDHSHAAWLAGRSWSTPWNLLAAHHLESR